MKDLFGEEIREPSKRGGGDSMFKVDEKNYALEKETKVVNELKLKLLSIKNRKNIIQIKAKIRYHERIIKNLEYEHKRLIQNGFRPVPRYADRFYVDARGNVYSIYKHGLAKKSSLLTGYEFICVMFQKPYRHTTTEYIHRLIAETFIPNPLNKKTVNHKDGDKKNNCVENLEWATQGENNLHATRVLGVKRNTSGLDKIREKQKKFTPKVVRIIRECESVKEAFEKVKEMKIMCSRYNVYDCYRRKSYKGIE